MIDAVWLDERKRKQEGRIKYVWEESGWGLSCSTPFEEVA